MFCCVFGMKQFPFTNHKWKSKMLNWPQSQWYIDCLMPFYRIKPQKCPPGVWDLRKTTNFADTCNTASLSLYSYCDLMWCDLSAKITRLLHKNLKRSSGIHWRHLHTGSHKSMIEKWTFIRHKVRNIHERLSSPAAGQYGELLRRIIAGWRRNQ